MKKEIHFLLIYVFLSPFLVAQNTLPIIKANSIEVNIQDGDTFKKTAWNISPTINPDIFTSSSKNKTVTFYTDIDSISVALKQDTKFDFVILLNDSIKAHTQIKYAPSFLETLKGAGEFKADTREIPEFTYQEASNPNLVALRKEFNLDAIAGTGNEVSKILNLLHWIHRVIPHDGNSTNPQILNAMSLLTVCKKDNRGLNCRGLATVLNECYLALGIKSRFITCLPKDPNDTECHVINMVYSNDLQKWLWIDPTNDAYVMNEKGELLSIEEVRQRLIADEPLILNPEANWNFKSSTVKDYYLYNYMAKNLYRFECPINSEYDSETGQKGKIIKYLQLIPMDYPEQNPGKTTYLNKSNETAFESYKTNNPEQFWKAPKLEKQHTPINIYK